MQILIVEDEKHLAAAIEQLLKEEKYLVDVVYTGKDGFDYAIESSYDVIILDIMLPEMSGLEVVRNLRKEKIATPVLLLTAKSAVEDKVTGLDYGADDYLTKPFSTEELLARVRALTRRTGEVVVDVIEFADLVMDVNLYTLSANGRTIKMGHKEVEILKILMQSPKVLTSKNDLIVKVWGVDSEAEDNNVEAYISFLRKKLQYLHSKTHIRTIRKGGYLLEEASDD